MLKLGLRRFLTDAGYQPEIAYFEVCHELKMLVDLMNEGGLNKARWSCSDTAQYGDYTNTCIDEHVRERMQYHLQRIQDGSFAKEFIEDQDAGAPKFKALQEEYGNVRIETVGPKLRACSPGTTARMTMLIWPPSPARSPVADVAHSANR